MKRDRTSLALYVLTLTLGLIPTVSQAQIVPDSSLPVNSIVAPNGNTFTIDGGTQAGGNLFHSFQDFSLPTGTEAFFNNSLDVQNIFSRVTGGNISNIDGLIRANGGASLFLLNPVGIVFGPNARLDIGGLFLTTTGDRILFEDGSVFSADPTQSSPLLSINVPIGIQFGATAQPIAYRAPFAASAFHPYDASTYASTSGLQVQPGQALTLLGGNLVMEGGVLTAPNGRIELGSVTPGSLVGFDPNTQTLSYPGIENFQDIHLSQGALVNTSGAGGGNIQVQGRVISVSDTAKIAANTLGAEDGGTLQIRASERLEITGLGSHSRLTGVFNTLPPDASVTGLFTTTLAGSSGRGSNIVIETNQLRVSEAGLIWAENRGAGPGGNLTIKANSVELVGNPAGADGAYSQISTGIYPTGTGQGGNLTIDADSLVAQHWSLASSITNGSGNAGAFTLNVGRLQLLDGAQMGSDALSSGNSGTVTVNASELVEVRGRSHFTPGEFSSGIFTSVEPGGSGNGGDLTVTTSLLRLIDGGKLAANTVGVGNAGNIFIRADRIEVADPLVDFTGAVSGIITSSVRNASHRGGDTRGQGGNITLETNDLRVFNGGQIIAGTNAEGNAGTITIRAGAIDLSGRSSDGKFSSSINARSSTNFSAGSIDLTVERLSVRDGANITVGNLGTGDAGNLNITASNIFLDNEGSLQAEVNGGSQGNISLNARQSLVLRHGSAIAASATGASTGGNITLDAPTIVGLDNSDIIANAVQGNGGNIQISTQGIFGLENRPQLTDESDITASSQFGVSGNIAITNPEVDPTSSLVNFSQEVVDPAEQVVSGCQWTADSEFVATGRSGVPANPNRPLSSSRSWSDVRDLSEFRGETVEAASVPTETPKPLVEATGWVVNEDGTVELVATANSPRSGNFGASECNPVRNGDRASAEIP